MYIKIITYHYGIITDHSSFVGNTSSSFSGQGSSGDFIVASQSQKPLIHSWHWNKHQSHDNYHTQEILTSLSYTPSGLYLVGGSKKGFLYIWDVSTGMIKCQRSTLYSDYQHSFVINNPNFLQVNLSEAFRLIIRVLLK